ncbi:hypothetical protein KKF55_06845, partial [Patescibacteria group bacterium]|nr:hypothetical protein [Patescibacteria group bacterium]
MFNLENIVQSTKFRLGMTLTVGLATLTMIACNAQATPTPSPTDTPKPAPTATAVPSPTTYPTETPTEVPVNYPTEISDVSIDKTVYSGKEFSVSAYIKDKNRVKEAYLSLQDINDKSNTVIIDLTKASGDLYKSLVDLGVPGTYKVRIFVEDNDGNGNGEGFDIGTIVCQMSEPSPTSTPEPTAIHTPVSSPTETPAYKNAQEYASAILPSYLAEQIPAIPLDGDPKIFIDELSRLPEYAQRIMAETGLAKHLINDGGVTASGLAIIEDLDQDDIPNLKEKLKGTNVFDPTNTARAEDNETTRFLANLIVYNASQGRFGNIANAYPGLENVIYVVENHPKIADGLNAFGNDALALLLADNQGVIDMDKYWFLTNATALQAQDFFYIGNEIMWDGRFKNEIKGPATDRKFDATEREITNFRLRKQVEWQGPWSTPLEYEEAVREYGSEQRASNALRWRVLPQRLFVDDVKGTGTHPLYLTFDANTWLAVALDNNSNSEAVGAGILARLNDPERYAKDAERIKGLYEGAATLPNVGTINQKASEYVDIIFSEGKPYEIADILIYLYAREQIHHDNATPLSALWATLVGASGGVGSARIIHPGGYETGDSQFMFTLSESTQKKLPGAFVYGVDDLAQLIPSMDRSDPKYLSLDGLFGVPYSNIDALRADKAKHLKVLTPSFYVIKVPIPK